MQLEDYLYIRKSLSLVKSATHKVYLESGKVTVERLRSPLFKAMVNIQGGFSIHNAEWLDNQPHEKEAMYFKKALEFLNTHFIIKQFHHDKGRGLN